MHPLTFSYPLDTLPPKPVDLVLKATPEERHHIALRLGLVSLENLEAKLRLAHSGLYFLKGTISADVTQHCSRTLSPLPQHLDIDVDEVFRPFSPDTKGDLTLDLEDLVEPLDTPVLDIGEIITQLLSLHLDPFPIAETSEPLDYQESDTPASAFSMLKDIK